MQHDPIIGSLSRPVVRMFGCFFRQPHRWFTVSELMTEAGASRATVYRRCGNLVAARVLRRRRQHDQAEFAKTAGYGNSALSGALLRRLENAMISAQDTAV